MELTTQLLLILRLRNVEFCPQLSLIFSVAKHSWKSLCSKYIVRMEIFLSTYCRFVTTVSQLKMCDFSGETLEGFEML